MFSLHFMESFCLLFFFFFQKKVLLLKWHLELFTLIYELGSTGKTVVLVQYINIFFIVLSK